MSMIWVAAIIPPWVLLYGRAPALPSAVKVEVRIMIIKHVLSSSHSYSSFVVSIALQNIQAELSLSVLYPSPDLRHWCLMHCKNIDQHSHSLFWLMELPLNFLIHCGCQGSRISSDYKQKWLIIGILAAGGKGREGRRWHLSCFVLTILTHPTRSLRPGPQYCTAGVRKPLIIL